MAKARVKADPGTKRAGAAESSKKGQELKKAYLEVKRRTLNYEKNNYTQLVVMKTQDGKWWKMFGHSAVIYENLIAPRLRLKAVRHVDTDYDEKSEEGFVGVPDIEKFQERLSFGKIYISNKTEWVRVFDLGERVAEEDYVAMLNEDKMREEMTNKLILPEVLLAELNAKAKKLLNIVHVNVRKMDGTARDAFGIDMERKVVKTQLMIVRAARGTWDVDDCLEQAYELMEDLYGYALIILNLQLMDAKVVYNITEAVVSMENQVKKELRKRALKAVDEKLDKRMRRHKPKKEENGQDDRRNTVGESKRVDFAGNGGAGEEAEVKAEAETKRTRQSSTENKRGDEVKDKVEEHTKEVA